MWELDHKECWVPKNSCFRIVVLEKTLESLYCKEIQPINPKGNQAWMFFGRTDAEAEASMFWPPDMKSQITGKDPDARKDRREKKGVERMRWLDTTLTQWTWIWANSRRQWSTEELGMLQSMGSQRVGHDLATEQQQHCDSDILPLQCCTTELCVSWDFGFRQYPLTLYSRILFHSHISHFYRLDHSNCLFRKEGLGN